MLDDTIWIIEFLSDADEVTKNPALYESSFTLEEAINKYKNYMLYWKFTEVKDIGEIAEMILNGLLCDVCGAYVDGEEPGHPRQCEDCAEEVKPKNKRPNKSRK